MDDTFTFGWTALEGLMYSLPRGDVPADLGEGPAATVHLLPDAVDCDEVLFVAEDSEMDDEGYWIHIERLRSPGERWPSHLAEKTGRGRKPAVVMLAEACARKTLEMRAGQR